MLKQVPSMIDRECKHYVKVCFKKAELIYKTPKGLEAEKRYCVGGTSENFEKGYEFAGDGNKMSGLTIVGANVDLNWLIKVKSHLDKIEREQEEV